MSTTRFLLAISFSLAACSSSGDDVADDTAGDDTAPTGPLYLAASWVADAEATNTYVEVFDSLTGTLDFADAIEVPGYGDAWLHGDKVYVAEGEAPTVRRFSIGDAGLIDDDLAISFANHGVTGASFYDNDILTDTVAYLSSPGQREYVVWNPTTMEITGTVPWPELAFDDGFEPFHGYTDRGGVVHDGLYFHAIYGHNEDFDAFGDKSFVLVHDVATNALVDTIEVPCPMMDVGSVGDDGYLYLSGWSYVPLSYLVGRTPVNCAARIDLATRAVDPTWTLTYPPITGGDEASALRAIDGTTGVLAVFHGSGVPVTPDMDIWDLDVADDDWELYEVDLAARTAEPTGVVFGDGSYYEAHVGDRYFVYLIEGPTTQVYERTAAGYEPRFAATGWLSRFFQLR